MARCLTCNWSSHDVSIHEGALCRSGAHPLLMVGVGPVGRCRACTAARARRYYAERRERENARSRAYHAANRDAIIERKRSKRRYRATIGTRRGNRGKEGAPPPPEHPWRKT